jgi:hypothetical protein
MVFSAGQSSLANDSLGDGSVNAAEEDFSNANRLCAGARARDTYRSDGHGRAGGCLGSTLRRGTRGRDLGKLNLQGRNVTWCADDHGQIRVSDLSTHQENLFFWENWTNRISSGQTFNFPSGFAVCLYDHTNYNPSGGDRVQWTNNFNDWELTGSTASMNDRASSIKYTATC